MITWMPCAHWRGDLNKEVCGDCYMCHKFKEFLYQMFSFDQELLEKALRRFNQNARKTIFSREVRNMHIEVGDASHPTDKLQIILLHLEMQSMLPVEMPFEDIVDAIKSTLN